jgi:hypothetical protein
MLLAVHWREECQRNTPPPCLSVRLRFDDWETEHDSTPRSIEITSSKSMRGPKGTCVLESMPQCC